MESHHQPFMDNNIEFTTVSVGIRFRFNNVIAIMMLVVCVAGASEDLTLNKKEDTLHFLRSFKERSDFGFGKTLPFGESCIIDSQCASKRCSGIISRSCVECESNEDCESGGVSKAGEMTKSFCIDSGRCSEWKRGVPIGPEGYPIQFPSVTRKVERKVMDNLVGEQVWHIPIDKQPNGTVIEVTDTHVKIPKHMHIIAAYAQNLEIPKRQESGIVSVLAGDNPLSVVTDRSFFYFAEKYHTLNYDGDWDQTVENNARKDIEDQGESGRKEAVENRKRRTALMAVWFKKSSTAEELVEAQQDMILVNQIRDYVTSEKARQNINAFMQSEGWASLSIIAKQAMIDAKTKTSLKSELECTHFEKGSGISQTNTHVFIPLNQELMTIKGNVQFFPVSSLGVLHGTVAAKYDKDLNTVELYMATTQKGEVNLDSTTNEGPSTFLVSPPYPGATVSAIDGRTDEYYSSYSYVDAVLEKAYLQYPQDYTYFEQDVNEACSGSVKQRLSSLAASVKSNTAHFAPDEASIVDTLKYTADFVPFASEAFHCNIAYLRNDIRGLNGVDAGAFGVSMHMFLEYDAKNAFDLYTRTIWLHWQDQFKV